MSISLYGLDIPLEVLQVIAQHLDVESAKQLCCASSSVRVIGEMKVWRDIRVTSKNMRDLIWCMSYSPSEEARMDRERSSELGQAIEQRLAALENYPMRKRFVQSLVVELKSEYTPSLRRLLSMVAPTARCLETSGTRNGKYMAKQDSGKWAVLAEHDWPRVSRFNVQESHLEWELITQVCKKMPVLDTLIIGRAEVVAPYTTLEYIPPLRHLFDWTGLRAPGTRRDRRFDPSHPPHPLPRPPTQNMVDLETLVLGPVGFRFPDAVQGPRRLKRVLWQSLPLENIREHYDQLPALHDVQVLGCGSANLGSGSQRHITRMIGELGPLPELRVLCSITHGPRVDEPREMTATAHQGRTSRLTESAIQGLLNAPKLEYVSGLPDLFVLKRLQLADVPLDDAIDQLPGPSDWEHTQQSDGVTIRTYLSTTADEVDGLFHLRQMIKLRPKSEVEIPTPQWTDVTWYKGKSLPCHVLDELYRIMGMDAEWLDPGRRVQLPPEAVAYLDQWHSQDEDESSETA